MTSDGGTKDDVRIDTDNDTFKAINEGLKEGD